jgi:hypothetical protein
MTGTLQGIGRSIRTMSASIGATGMGMKALAEGFRSGGDWILRRHFPE